MRRQGWRGGRRLARQDQHDHHDRRILAHAGLDPTVVIGGKAKVFGSNARLGSGEVLVAEADESDGSFRHLLPMVAVITNIDREHMDHYRDEAALRAAFLDFANQVPFYGVGRGVRRQPDRGGAGARAAQAARDLRPRRGRLSRRDPRGRRPRHPPAGPRARRGARRGAWCACPGIHYAQNALAALCVADVFGVPFATDLRGAGRRSAASTGGSPCAARWRGVLVVDDYGHHPTEMAATIAAARALRPASGGGVPAAPLHAHARISWTSFAPALAGADEVVLTDIYPAGEAAIAGVDAAGLAAHLPAGRGRQLRHASAPLAGSVAARLRPGRSAAHPGRGRHHPGGDRGARQARDGRPDTELLARTKLGGCRPGDRRWVRERRDSAAETIPASPGPGSGMGGRGCSVAPRPRGWSERAAAGSGVAGRSPDLGAEPQSPSAGSPAWCKRSGARGCASCGSAQGAAGVGAVAVACVVGRALGSGTSSIRPASRCAPSNSLPTAHLGPAEVAALAGVAVGDRLLGIDTDAVAGRIASHPWVSERARQPPRLPVGAGHRGHRATGGRGGRRCRRPLPRRRRRPSLQARDHGRRPTGCRC